MATIRVDEPALSVVVPVRDGVEVLNRTLSALGASDLARGSWELIVVDDASGDRSAEVAARYADRVVRLPVPGPGRAAARNRGVELARAAVIVFVDADVAVHPDALRRIRDLMAQRPDVSAVFGAYDLTPAAPGLVSQYRNLLHSYVHRRDAGEAVTFWTGLGAIRRDVWRQCGGFDEQERLEDVEFGYRISALGHRILLDPEIEGTHLKSWTLGTVITTDVMERGVPWVRLLLQGRRPPGRATLNVRGLERLLTGLMGIAMVALGIGLAMGGDPRWLLVSGLALTVVVGADWRLLRWLTSLRGWLFALGAIPLRLLYFGLNVIAVGLALAPVGHARPVPRATARAALRVEEPQAPVAGGRVVTEPLVVRSERATPVG